MRADLSVLACSSSGASTLSDPHGIQQPISPTPPRLVAHQLQNHGFTTTLDIISTCTIITGITTPTRRPSSRPANRRA
jgi:hypothetical protein